MISRIYQNLNQKGYLWSNLDTKRNTPHFPSVKLPRWTLVLAEIGMSANAESLQLLLQLGTGIEQDLLYGVDKFESEIRFYTY